MSVEVNGIAHIQLTVIDPACVPFWEKLCNFLEMRTLIKADDIVSAPATSNGLRSRVAKSTPETSPWHRL